MKLTEAQQNAVNAMKNNDWFTARDLNVAGSTMKGLVKKGVVEQRSDGMYHLKQKRKVSSVLMRHLMNTTCHAALIQ